MLNFYRFLLCRTNNKFSIDGREKNSRPEKDVARIRSIDRVERERGRRRGGKEIDFEAGSAVIPWPSADPLTRVHASTFETKEGRKEAKASLICCMSAGSDAFIMRPPASKRAPVPPLSLSLSLASIEEAKNGRLFHLVGLACVCVPRARNAPRGKHESASTCRLEWTMAAVTVKRTRGYRLTPLPRAYVTRRTGRCTTTLLFGWDCVRSRSQGAGDPSRGNG